MKSKIFVTLQFTLIIIIFKNSGFWGDITENIIMLTGLVIGLWAITTMNLRVNIFPDVRENQKLFTSGPYRYIRHPMYTAVLLTTLAWSLHDLNFVSSALWLLLLIVLLLKLRYEEKLLSAKFKSYESYKTKTKKLIPLIF